MPRLVQATVKKSFPRLIVKFHTGGISLASTSIVLAALSCLTGCSAKPAPEQKTLVIYHHGSPTPAIVAAEKVFEARYPDVKVVREKDDALANMRKVTDLGKQADLVLY